MRAFEKVLFLAIERLHVTSPILAMVALHRLAFIVRVDDSELWGVSRLAPVSKRGEEGT